MKRTRKVFALLLSICMIVTMLPTVAFAAGDEALTTAKIKGKELTVATLKKISSTDASKEITLNTSNVNTIELSYSEATGNEDSTFDGSEEDHFDAKMFAKEDVGFGKKSSLATIYTDSTSKSESLETSSTGTSQTSLKAGKTGTLDPKSTTDTEVWIIVKDNADSEGNYYVFQVIVKPADANAYISDMKVGKTNATVPVTGVNKNTVSTSESAPISLTVTVDHAAVPTAIQVTIPANAKAEYKVADKNESATWTGMTEIKTDVKPAPEGTPEDEKVVKDTSLTIGDVKTKYVFIKVTAENPDKTVYYRLQVIETDANANASVESLEVVDGTKTAGTALTGVDTFAAAKELTSVEYTVPYNKTKEASINLTVSKGAKLVMASGEVNIEEDFTINPTLTKSDSNGDYYDAVKITGLSDKVATDVYIKLTSQAETEPSHPVKTAYYKLSIKMVEGSTIATIDSITIDGYKCEPSTDEDGQKKGNGSSKTPYEWEVTIPDGAKFGATSTVEVELTDATANVVADVREVANITDSYSSAKLIFPDKDKVRTKSGDLSTFVGSDAKKLCFRVIPQAETGNSYYAVELKKAVLEVGTTETATPTEGVTVSDKAAKSVVETAVKATKFDEERTNLNAALYNAVYADVALAEKLDTKTAKTLLESLNLGSVVEEGSINFFAVPYLDIKVTDSGYERNESGTYDTYEFDAKPKYYVVATTAATVTDLNLPDDNVEGQPNAVKLTTSDKTLDGVKDVPVVIGLPSGFVSTPGTDKVYVDIDKEGFKEKTSEADSTVKVTFPHFSHVTIKKTPNTVAKIGTDEYESLQDAVNEVAGEGTIDLTKSNPTDEELKATVPAIEAETGTFTFNIKNSTSVDAEELLAKLKNSITPPLDGETFKYEIAITSDEKTPATFTVTLTKTAKADEGNGDDEEGDGEGGTNSNHKVTVAEGITNGTVTVDNTNEVAKDTVVTVTVKPAEGYELDVLTIKTDSGAVPRDEGENGTYTFKMPAADVTVSATFKVIGTETEDTICKPYTDVDSSKDSWYHDHVHYMIENGLMTGVAADKFAPQMNLNRAMVTQILYAKANKPTDFTASKTFSDVEKDQWYTNAVLWAAANGAVDGYEDGSFKPLQDVTRQELAVMLYGMKKMPAVTDNGELKAFADAASVADWAQSGMLWAVQSDIMDGDNHNNLKPTATATRAEAAAMLYQYFN